MSGSNSSGGDGSDSAAERTVPQPCGGGNDDNDDEWLLAAAATAQGRRDFVRGGGIERTVAELNAASADSAAAAVRCAALRTFAALRPFSRRLAKARAAHALLRIAAERSCDDDEDDAATSARIAALEAVALLAAAGDARVPLFARLLRAVPPIVALLREGRPASPLVRAAAAALRACVRGSDANCAAFARCGGVQRVAGVVREAAGGVGRSDFAGRKRLLVDVAGLLAQLARNSETRTALWASGTPDVLLVALLDQARDDTPTLMQLANALLLLLDGSPPSRLDEAAVGRLPELAESLLAGNDPKVGGIVAALAAKARCPPGRISPFTGGNERKVEIPSRLQHEGEDAAAAASAEVTGEEENRLAGRLRDLLCERFCEPCAAIPCRECTCGVHCSCEALCECSCHANRDVQAQRPPPTLEIARPPPLPSSVGLDLPIASLSRRLVASGPPSVQICEFPQEKLGPRCSLVSSMDFVLHDIEVFDSGFVPRVVFDCTAELVDGEASDLVFESRFESGNLHRAVRIGPREYELAVSLDTNTRSHMQWFYFSVRNMEVGATYRFNIVNMEKPSSEFSCASSLSLSLSSNFSFIIDSQQRNAAAGVFQESCRRARRWVDAVRQPHQLSSKPLSWMDWSSSLHAEF